VVFIGGSIVLFPDIATTRQRQSTEHQLPSDAVTPHYSQLGHGNLLHSADSAIFFSDEVTNARLNETACPDVRRVHGEKWAK
jgi:hypothetical protein